MVLFNYSTRELTAKIVYYGPGLCGKTTNLQYIHGNLPDSVKGKMLSLATKTDRTLFFDFLPIDLGEIRGMKTRVQLYTVPGQVFYNETRKLVLKGADGIVFVADSQEQMAGANVESFRNLEENLKTHGLSLAELPHVIQFNKRDLPKLAGIEQMNAAVNRYNAPFYESVATTGIGVQDTLKAVTKLVLLHLTKKYDPHAAAKPAAKPATTPAPPPVAVTPPPAVGPSARARAGEVGSIPVSSLGAKRAEGGGGIPLSAVEDPFPQAPQRHAPPPPNFDDRGQKEEPVPAFAEQEIDELVDEVEESEKADQESHGVERGPAEPTPAEPAMAASGTFTVGEAPDEALPSLEEVQPFSPVVEPPSATETDPQEGMAASAEPAQVDAPTPEPPSQELQLEVDLGFDPDWQDEQDEDVEERKGPGEEAERTVPIAAARAAAQASEDPSLRAAGSEASYDLGESREAMGEGTPIPIHHVNEEPAEKSRQADDAAVVLTEAVGDDDLFEDPNLEVAKLSAGDTRRIEVPVQIGEGEAARRFKLSVTLKLDPLS